MRNYFFVSLFASCYSTVGSDLLVPFQYTDQYELMFLFRGDFVNMNGGMSRCLASIDIATNRTTTLMGQFAREDIYQANGIVLGDGHLRIHERIIALNSPERWHVILGGNFESQFSRQVGSYLLVPTSDTDGQLIINPIDPSVYVYEGELFYTSPIVEDSPKVNATVTMYPGSPGVPPTVSETVSCTLETTKRINKIPRRVMRAFLAELERIGLDPFYLPEEFDQNYDYISISRISDSDLERMPTIHFTIELHGGSLVNVDMRPRDYIVSDSLFHGVDDATRLIVFSSPDESSCSITASVLRRVAIHVDSVNRRIGFGEPLTELT